MNKTNLLGGGVGLVIALVSGILLLKSNFVLETIRVILPDFVTFPILVARIGGLTSAWLYVLLYLVFWIALGYFLYPFVMRKLQK